MGSTIGHLAGILLPIVAIIAVFTFVAIASWADARRREREAYYRHETYKKLIEQPGGSSQAVLDLLRQEEDQAMRRRIEGLRLGGLITTAVGLGVSIFLYYLEPQKPIFVVGLIPLLIGLVLMVYGFLVASMPSRT
jgi:hypothetical protein